MTSTPTPSIIDSRRLQRFSNLEPAEIKRVRHFGAVHFYEAGDALAPAVQAPSGSARADTSWRPAGAAIDRAMKIAYRLTSYLQESIACIKRLVRNATETPLAQGLALERNLFLKLCISEPARDRMRSYEAANITSPSRSIEVDIGSTSRG